MFPAPWMSVQLQYISYCGPNTCKKLVVKNDRIINTSLPPRTAPNFQVSQFAYPWVIF